uniref:Motility associated factor glycosyltransferase family protein n=1 Tax=Candidatus Desulfatibia profunda TaxID=2841695 RepID=A0A8J6TL41_9BACT|nr:motility associated factor glycosyltransferase family protein [Candidatus Desulfatibia profunda]
MRCLENRSQILAKRLSAIRPDPCLELTAAESGDWTAKKHFPNEAHRFIHSRIDPKKEAKLWLQSQDLIMPCLVILGVGLGYQVFELFKNCRSPEHAYLIEADEGLFRLALTVYDFSSLIQNTRVHFIVGEPFSVVAKRLLTSLIQSFSCHLVSGAVSSCPDRYTPVRKLVEKHLYALRLREKNGETSTRGQRLAVVQGVEHLLNQMRTT